MRFINPKTTAAPIGTYSHAVLSEPGEVCLHVSGQIGLAADGSVPSDFEAQAHLCWKNLLAVLRAADMDISNLAKTTVFVTDTADLATFARVRNSYLGEHRPASSLMIVAALSRADCRIEIEAVAYGKKCP